MTFPIVTMGDLTTKSHEFGNKVKNLAFLAQVGVKVPRGFGIPYRVYRNHVEPLLPEMERIRERSGDDCARMAEELQRLIITAPLAEANDIRGALDEHIGGVNYFAVRSSGAPIIEHKVTTEDSAKLSLAGQYESYLFVPAQNVPQAIAHCFASLFAERSLRRFRVAEDGGYLWSTMSVLVQEMYDAELSAVIMTKDPVEGGDTFGIEVTYGACEAIVSGEVQADLYLLSRSSGNILSAEVGSKTRRVCYVPLTDWNINNVSHQDILLHERSQFAATREIIERMYHLGMYIERHYGSPQDIELVVSGGEIIITQTRPITGTK